MRKTFGAFAAIGTKSLFWPAIITNLGTLTVLVFGRRNPAISSVGIGVLVVGLLLMLRYALARQRSRNSSITKVV